LAARFAEEPDCALGGRVVNALPGNRYSTATHALIEYLYSYYNASPQTARFFTPNNLAVPTEQFLALGGFDVSFVTASGEDREFCDRWTRHGYRMRYVPEVAVAHAHPLSFAAFCRQHFNYGRGSLRYRKVQARSNNRPIRVEPLRFYFDLLRFPCRIAGVRRKFQLASLIGISQIANAAGFCWERSRANRR
jgi:GT2 family glycosyltransferase